MGLACLVVLPAPTSGLADGTTIEPAEKSSGYYWSPSTATVAPGGSVGFRNPGEVVPHGLAWTGGPEKPTCSGVPVDSSGTDWSGTCTFAQAGTYAFVCTIHAEMQGSVTVAAGGGPPSPAPTPTSGPAPETPLNGDASQALRLARHQRGGAIRGSVDLSPTAAGGRMTLQLRAAAAALGVKGGGTVGVGRLVRAPLGAGRQGFAVTVKPVARRALRQRGRLPVTVEIVVSPPAGAAAKLTRRVVAHA
jgi:plastocyanin